MYKDAGAAIQRLSDGVFIPKDPFNRLYLEFLEWKKLGNSENPLDPIPPEPVKEDWGKIKRQFLKRAALFAVIKKAGIEDSIKLMLGIQSEDIDSILEVLTAARTTLTAPQQTVFTTAINNLLAECNFPVDKRLS